MAKQIVILMIGPDNQVQMQAQTGTYDEGVQNFQRIVGQLETNGVQIPELGQVEKHRHHEEETEEQRAAHRAAHMAGFGH